MSKKSILKIVNRNGIFLWDNKTLDFCHLVITFLLDSSSDFNYFEVISIPFLAKALEVFLRSSLRAFYDKIDTNQTSVKKWNQN